MYWCGWAHFFWSFCMIVSNFCFQTNLLPSWVFDIFLTNRCWNIRLTPGCVFARESRWDHFFIAFDHKQEQKMEPHSELTAVSFFGWTSFLAQVEWTITYAHDIKGTMQNSEEVVGVTWAKGVTIDHWGAQLQGVYYSHLWQGFTPTTSSEFLHFARHLFAYIFSFVNACILWMYSGSIETKMAAKN